MPHALSMKKLLIGTIFARDDENQRKWFDLQMAYLKATTEDFDHITYLYGPQTDWFESRTKVIKAAFNNFRDSTAHIEGLNSLLAHFKFFKDDYENFLFIDSDAFPIRLGWQDLLNRRMGNQHKIATVLRSENLETRWHSSVVYAKKEGLAKLKFDYIHLMDLTGYDEKDVGMVSHQASELRDTVFPLLRSNRYNLHPTLCGVYYDIFYHHCCGSGRTYNMKSRFYWDHFCNRDIDVGVLTDKLFENPDKFMEQFAWHPEHYGKVSK